MALHWLKKLSIHFHSIKLNAHLKLVFAEFFRYIVERRFVQFFHEKHQALVLCVE